VAENVRLNLSYRVIFNLFLIEIFAPDALEMTCHAIRLPVQLFPSKKPTAP